MHDEIPARPGLNLSCPQCGHRATAMRRLERDHEWICDLCCVEWYIENVTDSVIATPPQKKQRQVKPKEEPTSEQA